MIPDKYMAFLQGSTGASAALLGLLFVAIQLAPARTIGNTAPVGRRSTAESTFTALVNVFFISLVGLTPGTNIGTVTVIMALIGLVSTLHLGGDYWRTGLTRQGRLRGATLLLASLVVYALELLYAVQLLRTPSAVGSLDNLIDVLIAIYGVGLGRAWSLVGGQSKGILDLLLGPQDVAIPASTAGGESDLTDPVEARGASASSPAPLQPASEA
jgi:hypothetical protein